jgi:hypothetical protein
MCPVDAAKVSGAGVEGPEQLEEVITDMIPGGTVEAGPKTVRAGGAVPIHPPDGGLDLLELESLHQRRPVDTSGTSIKGVEVESPARGPRLAQEVGVEVEEEASFPFVVDDVSAARVQGPDRAAAKSLRGAGMKELRVLVPFADGPVLAALLPESSPLLDGEGKGITRKPTEKQLST